MSRLKNGAIKKIVISTISLGVMLLLCVFPKTDEDTIPEEVIYVDELTMPIYVMDQNKYIARTEIIKADNDTIKYIIDALTINSSTSTYLPNGFTSIIPKDTKLIDYVINNKLLKINFSKEILNISKDNEEKLLEALIYSLCELENVDKIMIFVDGSLLQKLPNSGKMLPTTLDKNYGINKMYDFDNIKNTTKTTIYYFGKYSNTTYFIPITKITNEKLEPVEIIIKELKSTPIYESNLISYLNASYELKDYEVLENSISLSFNNSLINSLDDNSIIEKVKYSLVLSLRDTYDIKDIVINLN